MATSNGNCFICGKTAGKTAIKNHVLKEHNSGDEACYLIKAENPYSKDMWLLFTVPLTAALTAVDKFLRQIWCECCGHMSAFYRGGYGDFPDTRKVGTLRVGDTLMYEYDFGSTTEIALTVVDAIKRPKQKERVRLLARNAPPELPCEKCGKPATVIAVWENEALCDKCAETVEDEALLPIVNSPRCGECAYCGEQDIWTFDPSKPFPQP